MKKVLFILILLTSFSNGKSQTWCPPGAIWHYDYINFAVAGFVKMEYTSDTIINSIACKKIVETHSGYSWWNSQNYSYTQQKFTYDSLGIVYFYIEPLDVFDTLYNFNAVPGDKWQMINNMVNHPQCDSIHWINVLDTGHVVLNSFNLKWLYVNLHYQTEFGNSDAYDTIYERIGTIQSYMFPYDNCNAGLDVNEGGEFRCYQDNQFSLLKRVNYDCDKMPIAGIDEEKTDLITLFPNPVTNTLNGSLWQSYMNQIRIYDVLGNLVLNENISRSSFQIDCTGWRPGVYFMEIISEKGSIEKKKFLKIN